MRREERDCCFMKLERTRASEARPARERPRCSSIAMIFFWYEESSSALRWKRVRGWMVRGGEFLCGPLVLRGRRVFCSLFQRRHFLALRLQRHTRLGISVLVVSYSKRSAPIPVVALPNACPGILPPILGFRA